MSIHPRLLFCVLSIFLMIGATASSPAVGETSPGSSPAAMTPDQARQTPAGKFIQDLGDRAIGIVANQGMSQAQRDQIYHAMLHDAFDMPTIGHFVIGRAWKTATPEQQQEYMKLFEQLVVRIYGDRLNLYSGESFQVKSVRQEDEKDVVVNSQILHPDGKAPTAVDWRVRQADGKMAIVDVVVEGVSQSVTQRQEYASIIQQDGGKLDKLLQLMREKLQAPSTSGGG